MLKLSKSYYNQHVLSLRTGGKIGVAVEPIINPNTLKIEGWYCTQNYEKGAFILPIDEVRDVIAKGIVVNDHDSLTVPEDMIRLKHIIELHFQLTNKTVKTETNKKLGKIADYCVDDVSGFIQKLYVNPTLLRGITQDQFIVDRTDILEITDREVIVKETLVPVQSAATMPLQA